MTHSTDPSSEGNPITRALKLEPAVVRGVLVGVTAIVATITGKSIGTEWIENALFVYVAVSPIIAGLLIRPKVTPNVKVQFNDFMNRIRTEAAKNPSSEGE